MRYAVAFVFMFAAGPAAAELQCEMQKGRLVCDYSAALMAAATVAPAGIPVSAAEFSAEENPYDRGPDAEAIASLCSAAADDATIGC